MRRIKDEEWPPYQETNAEIYRGLLWGGLISLPFWLILYLVWRWVW